MVDGVSSADVSASHSVDEDLRVIYQGGENFLARMRAMSNQTAELRRAIEESGIGSNAKAAFEDAKTKQREAALALAEATRRLAAASAEATRLTNQARQDAAKVTSEAKARAAGTLRSAETAAAETRVTAESLKNQATVHHAEAKTVLDDAQAAKAKADATSAELQAAMLQTKQAEMSAAQMKDKYEGLLSHIAQAHKEFVDKVSTKL
jgi:cell division septum initiation protein DivIVA